MGARGLSVADGTGRRRAATATSSFGVGRRENHDSAAFYARFTSPTVSDDQMVDPPGVVDQIYVGDSRSMDRVRPASFADYLALLEGVFAECAAKLEPGGRIAVNVANLGRKPYRSLSADVIGILQDRLGLLLRGEVIWRKARGAGGNCAWGSFRSPTNPVLRDLTERVVIASKGRFDRAIDRTSRARAGLPHEPTPSADEFMEATLDVWELAPESARRVGHPAPFPVELPQRLIELYTWRGDVVLDPFMGVGSAAVAAVRTGRHYLGYDTDETYVDLARRRAADELERVLAAGPPSEPTGTGGKAVAVAAGLLRAAGFAVDDKGRRKVSGVDVPLVATDTSGHEWLVDVVGGFSITRPGLRRTDVLERALR